MLDTDLIPAKVRDSRRLMVILHGLGDSMEGYRDVPRLLELPWLNYLLVNAPDEYFTGYSWFDFPGNIGPGVERSGKLLFQLLDQWREKGYPTQQTVVFGFSQGCLMTIEVGTRYPHVLAGLIGISGWTHDVDRVVAELPPLAQKQRFLITHGTDDPLLPFAEVREQVNLLKAAGLNIEWHEFVKAHTIAGQAEIDVIRAFIEASYPEKV